MLVACAGQAGDGGPQSIVERDLGNEADLVAEPADVGDEALWLAGTCRACVQLDELRTAQQIPKPGRNIGDRRCRSGADVDGSAHPAVEHGGEGRACIADVDKVTALTAVRSGIERWASADPKDHDDTPMPYVERAAALVNSIFTN